MSYLDQDAVPIVRTAQGIVFNAKWHICVEDAVQRMSDVRGLAHTPLLNGHDVIHVVACAGALRGRIRRHQDQRGTRWVVTATASAHDVGAYRTLRAAVRSLDRRAFRHVRRVTAVPD